LSERVYQSGLAEFEASRGRYIILPDAPAESRQLRH
jgi:hypothetical protein